MTVVLTAVAWLMTYLLHSTVLLAGALALAGLGLIRTHAARDTLWKVALVGGLVTATAQTILGVQPTAGHLAIAARPESPLVDVAGVREVTLPVARLSDEASPAVSFADAMAPTPSIDEGPRQREVRSLMSGVHVSWPAMLLNIWFVGALGFGARLLWTRIALARGLRERRQLREGPLPMMLSELAASAGLRAPRLSVSRELSGPIAFGREICLPARLLTDLPAEEQRAVLAHELGHVVRHDPVWLMIALFIESCFFVQPLNRFVRRHMRASSEYLCDDWAAERTGGMVLARCLAEVAGWVQTQPAPAVAPGMAGHCSHLVSRVERLLDGSSQGRPTRAVLRVALAALALGAIAWSVPGVAAEDLNAQTWRWSAGDPDPMVAGSSVQYQVRDAAWDGTGWASLRDDGHLLVLAPGYSVRLRGRGRLGFRQWGRAIVVPDGYEIRVDGHTAGSDRDLCDNDVVRIVSLDGDGGWDVEPLRVQGAPVYAESSQRRDRDAQTRTDARLERNADLLAQSADDLGRNAQLVANAGIRTAVTALTNLNVSAAVRPRVRVGHDPEADAATDAALDGQADAAIDTLLQLWVRDPEAVRRAARRIARTYDRDLRPQFESLGVEVGRQLAPQLQRLTDRVGRDLTPEFARMGAELGLSIVSALGEDAASGAGTSDYRRKRNPKDR